MSYSIVEGDEEMEKTGYLGLLVCLAIVSAAVFIAGCSKVGITGNVVGSNKCTKEEAYTVQIPYNDTEYEWVEECYDRRQYCKDLAYTDFTLDVAYFGRLCTITVKNTGDMTGNWNISAQFIINDVGGKQTSAPIEKTLKPGETAKFEFTYGGTDMPRACINKNYEIPVVKDCPCYTIGKKRVPKLVTKYGTETLYRNVSVFC